MPYCIHVHENIREPQLLQTASRPRCQSVTQCAGCVSASTRPHQHVHMYTCMYDASYCTKIDPHAHDCHMTEKWHHNTTTRDGLAHLN